MTVWNLTDSSEFEDRVTIPFEAAPRTRTTRRSTHISVRRMVLVAAAATVITLGAGYVNSTTFSVPLSVINVAESGSLSEKPPLEALFAGQFDENWTKAVEEQLLATLVSKGSPTKNDFLKQTVETIFFNQNEDVSSGVPGLTKMEILKIIKERKLV